MREFDKIINLVKINKLMPDSGVLINLIGYMITKNLNDFTESEVTQLKNCALSQIQINNLPANVVDLFSRNYTYNFACQVLKSIAPRIEELSDEMFLKLKSAFRDEYSAKCLEALAAYSYKTSVIQAESILDDLLCLHIFAGGSSDFYSSALNQVNKRKKTVERYLNECIDRTANILLTSIYADLLCQNNPKKV
ncbi:MAG: hypothetical protein WC627_12155, partial [Legionella sp.]